MSLINDTLKFRGKWSRKSLTSFFSFWAALTYEFIMPLLGVDTKEYVFLGLLGLTGGVLGLTVIDKIKGNARQTNNKED